MRNNYKPIIIHDLIERTHNKKNMSGKRFDFCEEMILIEKRKLKLAEAHEIELEREKEGRFVDFSYEGMNYKILIRKDQNMKERLKSFEEKLKHKI